MRLAFYYPWFPRNWTQNGIYPLTNFHPSLGYDSSNPEIIRRHIDAMQYGNIDGGIASWGGGSEEDRNFAKLLTGTEGPPFKWREKETESGYGAYLDALHLNGEE